MVLIIKQKSVTMYVPHYIMLITNRHFNPLLLIWHTCRFKAASGNNKIASDQIFNHVLWVFYRNCVKIELKPYFVVAQEKEWTIKKQSQSRQVSQLPGICAEIMWSFHSFPVRNRTWFLVINNNIIGKNRVLSVYSVCYRCCCCCCCSFFFQFKVIPSFASYTTQCVWYGWAL